MNRLLIAACGALSLAFAVPAAHAAGETPIPPSQSWSFSGPFGMFDRAQLQRGFQVYKEVCAACHSMNLLSYRNLGQAGGPSFSEDQVKAIAASFQVRALNDQGEMVERPAVPADRFRSPFPNVQAAAAANNGKAPPDLSVMAKARTYPRGFPFWMADSLTLFNTEQGANYLYGFLTGYSDPPEGTTGPDGLNYNKYYPGHWVAMPNILADGVVTYMDSAPQTVSQYARDVSAFLMWAAEPKLEERKRMGLQVMIFLLVFAGLLYFTKKKVWKSVAH
jgi:cytochrome c1